MKTRRSRGRGGLRRPTGITLIELIVVMAILAIMSAIAIPTLARLGFFSRNELQAASRELYQFMKASKLYAATHRTDTAVAYGLSLRLDSVTGQVVEAIDAASMVYKMPEAVRARCYFFTDLDGAVLDPPVRIPQEGGSNYDAYIPVTGEHEQGMFRAFPRNTAVNVENLLPDGSLNPLGLTFKPVRIYQVSLHHYDIIQTSSGGRQEPVYEAETVVPLLVDDADPVLAGLPVQLQYLQSWPAGRKYVAYASDLSQPPSIRNGQDFGFPAHVFKPSGRMDSNATERFDFIVGYAPDADPTERFVNGMNAIEGERTINIEMYRSTGRVQIVRD